MCFMILEKKQPVVKVAKRNIYCYKILQSDATAFYRNLIVRVNKRKIKTEKQSYQIGFIYTEEAKLQLKWNKNRDRWDGNKGFHSYVSEKIANSAAGWNSHLFKFMIPKGTKYYKNNKHYFSQSIQRIS